MSNKVIKHFLARDDYDSRTINLYQEYGKGPPRDQLCGLLMHDVEDMFGNKVANAVGDPGNPVYITITAEVVDND